MQIFEGVFLSVLIFFPLCIAAFSCLLPNLKAVRWTSMAASLLSLAHALVLWWRFDGNSFDLQFVEAYEWLPDLGIRYIVGVDGLSLLLVVFTAFITPLVILSQWHEEDKKHRFFFPLILALESMMLAALCAIDFVFFYVFWEAMLIPMYFLIGIWGGSNRIYATMKFFIYTLAGSLLMLVAAVALYHYSTAQLPNPSTNLLDLYTLEIPFHVQTWLFAAFFLAFAIKVPLWPFHTWLPDAHVQAPTAGSVILAGVMLKMGTYGMLRMAIPMFPQAAVAFAPFITALGIIGIIVGALVAWRQEDAKKLVAYSSVSHLGFVVIGSFAFLKGGTQISYQSLYGSVYQMINHGISTGALFFLVGVIYEKRHTRMLKDFGGLAEVMPVFAILLIIATMSSVGLPGTGGFVGEFLILLGTFQSSPLAGALASLGVLLGAIYMLTLCKALLFGPLDNPENKSLTDLNLREKTYLIPLCVLAIVMGIFPDLFMGKAKRSIEHLSQNFSSYSLSVHSSETSRE